MEKKLDLVEQHKQNEIFFVHLKPSLSKQRNGHPSDVKEDGFTNLFSKDCYPHVTNSVSGDLKKYFSIPIYDEYEDKYLDVVPKKPAVNSSYVSEENMIVTQSQKAEKIKDNECVEGDNLPFCYSSFELIRKRLKSSKQKHNFEDMENFIKFLKVGDEEGEQSCRQSQHVEKSVVCDEEMKHKEGY